MRAQYRQVPGAEEIGLLKTCGGILKIYAWLVLFAAAAVSLAVVLGAIPSLPRWTVVVIAAVYTFLFFLIYTVALIADAVCALAG